MHPSLRFLCGASFVALSFSTLPAQTVTFVASAGSFSDSSGADVPTGSLVLLVADTAQNGFGSLLSGHALVAGSFLNGDDQIVGRMVTASDGLAADTFALVPLASNPSPGAYTSLNTGDPLAVVWFSMLDGTSTQLTAGDNYGLFFNSSLTDTVDGNPWFVPAQGNTITLHFLTGAQGGTHAAIEGRTSLAVSAIPEPAMSAAVAGIVLFAVAARGRRSRSSA